MVGHVNDYYLSEKISAMHIDYKATNKASWNERTKIHWESDFYDNKSFLAGANSLKDIETPLLGDLTNKSVLHLQCHFGQDTISLTRLGATKAVGVDLSDEAVSRATELAALCNSPATFICCDVYDLPQYLDEQFDIVFTSYGTIGWLPDINRWASIVAQYLKPGGKFVMAEFHPVVWMYDSDFKAITYDYFHGEPIVEQEGTYTDGAQSFESTNVTWNHGLAEVMGSLLRQGLSIDHISEYDYSPYECFANTKEVSPGRYRIAAIGPRIPMVYALSASK